MQFIKKQWLTIKVFLEGLPRDTKLLVVTLALFLCLMVFVFMQYAASSEMVPLRQIAPERHSLVQTKLDAHGIRTESRGGLILVPAEKQFDALAILAQDQLLAADTTGAFDEMIRNQSPWDSDRQNRQRFLLAKQKVLGEVIARMAGVRNAVVMIDMPQREGFGATHVKPSASVNVVMDGSSRVNTRLVESIAGWVSGAIAELEPARVVVIDANSGRQFTGKNQNDFAAGESFEDIQNRETHYRSKVERALGYIPGVIVAVNVLTDSMVAEERQQYVYTETEPLASERRMEESQRNGFNAGEAGARPNTGATIEGGGGESMVETRTESETEFREKPLTQESRTTIRGNTTKSINVTVNVPRPYFVSLYMQANAGGGDDAATEPDDATLRSFADKHLREIESQVQPLITAEGDSIVRAHLIPDPRQMIASFNPQAETSGMLVALSSGYGKTIGLAALALMSLAIMFTMVRKATQQPQLPTVEELAGVPPTLDRDDDLIGEAYEEDGAMPGVEVDEDHLRSRKIADQISEMIKTNPSEAAAIVGKWIRTEE
jgi:flagellar M-ring protein FliF